MDGRYFSDASAVTAASASGSLSKTGAADAVVPFTCRRVIFSSSRADGLTSTPVPIGTRDESAAEAAERCLSACWWGAGIEATIVVKAM
jgi:hypothetical protein